MEEEPAQGKGDLAELMWETSCAHPCWARAWVLAWGGEGPSRAVWGAMGGH